MELNRTERIVQTAAAAFGFGVAGFISFRVGVTSGVDIGVAAFVVSWTFVALFVLLVRFVTRRLLMYGTPTLPSSSTPAERPSPEPGAPRRRRRRRRR